VEHVHSKCDGHLLRSKCVGLHILSVQKFSAHWTTSSSGWNTFHWYFLSVSTGSEVEIKADLPVNEFEKRSPHVGHVMKLLVPRSSLLPKS